MQNPNIPLFQIPTCILMSLQDRASGEILFYMKGADVVMTNVVQYSDWLEEEVGYMFLQS